MSVGWIHWLSLLVKFAGLVASQGRRVYREAAICRGMFIWGRVGIKRVGVERKGWKRSERCLRKTKEISRPMNRQRPAGRPSPVAAPPPAFNPALARLLGEGAQNPDADRLPLLRELLTARLMVPILQPAGRTGTGRADNIKLAVLQRQAGLALCGFTDADAYARVPSIQSLPHVQLAAVDLCRFARQGNFLCVAINPGGPVGYEMSPLEYQMIAERLLPGEDGALQITSDTPARIGMPSERPGEDVIAALRGIVSGAGIEEAYWFWMALGGGHGHLALAVANADAATIRAVGEQVSVVWKAASPANFLLDILPLSDDELSRAIRAQGEKLLPSS